MKNAIKEESWEKDGIQFKQWPAFTPRGWVARYEGVKDLRLVNLECPDILPDYDHNGVVWTMRMHVEAEIKRALRLPEDGMAELLRIAEEG